MKLFGNQSVICCYDNAFDGHTVSFLKWCTHELYTLISMASSLLLKNKIYTFKKHHFETVIS